MFLDNGRYLCLDRFLFMIYTNDKVFLSGLGVMHGILHAVCGHVGEATKTTSIEGCFCVYSSWYESADRW